MKKSLLAVAALLWSLALIAGEKDSLERARERALNFIDSVNKAMKYETGVIKLPDGTVQLTIPQGFKYLNAEQSRFVITDLWGNPPNSTILGMIFPEEGGPLADSSFAFVITYDPIGYVKDEDADKIDYNQMLKDIQKDEIQENLERQKQGYSPIHMIGWAQKPYYDKENKILHWAKELKFGDAEAHTLNYDVRILGRKGILSLNAVATMSELGLVKNDIPKVLHIASFTSGNTYKDFDPKVDEVAAWTIGGLVAGKVLAKVGLLAFLGKFLKFIIIGIVALGAGIVKFFRRKKQENVVYEPVQADPPAGTEQNG